MKIVKEEEKDESQILIIGIADNSLKDPAPCIKHTLQEIINAGHIIKLYTHHQPGDTKRLNDLKAFLAEIGLDLEINYGRIEADVYYDDKNYGHAPGMFALFGSFLASELIAGTQRNHDLMVDYNFWRTGEEGKPNIITEAEGKARKIILPGGKQN